MKPGRLPLYYIRRKDSHRASHPPYRHLCLPNVRGMPGAAGMQDARHRPIRARRSARARRGPLSRLHDLHSSVPVRRGAENAGCAAASPSERRVRTLNSHLRSSRRIAEKRGGSHLYGSVAYITSCAVRPERRNLFFCESLASLRERDSASENSRQKAVGDVFPPHKFR